MIDNSKGHSFIMKYDLSKTNGLEYFECENCKIIICKLSNYQSSRNTPYICYMIDCTKVVDYISFDSSKRIDNLLTCNECMVKAIIQ